ncbi:PhnB protein [Desulfosporosinus sp. I2]|nr:PhnB protein [Desulfosporosinus sp. I2]
MTLQLVPFLMMDGNAKEAIQFYEKSLDAKVLFNQSYAD